MELLNRKLSKEQFLLLARNYVDKKEQVNVLRQMDVENCICDKYTRLNKRIGRY